MTCLNGPTTTSCFPCGIDTISTGCACIDKEEYLDQGWNCGAMLDLYKADPMWGLYWGLLDGFALALCFVCDTGATVAEA